MQQNFNSIIIKLQMGLNQRMYDTGKISYNIFSQTNEILISRLTQLEKNAIIILNKKTIINDS